MDATFTDEQKRAIVGKARTVFERLDGPTTSTNQSDEEEVDELLAAWRETLGGEVAFQRRLDRDDLTESACREAIRSDRLPDDAPLPAWIETLEAIGLALRGQSRSDFESADPDPHPFVEFFAAVSAHARERLPDDSAPESVSTTALDSMEGWLCKRIVGSFTRLLYVKFKTFIALDDPDLAFADPADYENPPTAYYEAFVDGLFGDRFVDLCLDYPVFGRLLAVQVDQWVSFVLEFCDRLDADRDVLADRFNDGQPLGGVRNLETLADDTHGGGKAVLQVTFESGVEVVYKPRSVDAAVAFYEVLGRLDAHLAIPSFEQPTLYGREDYGWMALISSEDCATTDAVERYYLRSGGLLCITYLLGFIDCHQENLIAKGEHPVLVDCEPAFHPPASLARRPLEELSFSFVQGSVLRVGLLPWMAERDGTDETKRAPENRVGFGAEALEKSLSEYEVPSVEAPNTDVMTVEFVTPTVDLRANTPTLDSESQSPGTYADSLTEGFRTTYETIQALREDGTLHSEIAPFDAFVGVENRFLFRGTQVYLKEVSAIEKSALEGGTQFTIAMEKLTAPFVGDKITDDGLWPLYAAEREAIKCLDPPRFTSRADETTLYFGGSKLDVHIQRSGVEAARERFDAMGQADLQRQLRIIEHCFNARSPPANPSSADVEDQSTDVEDKPPDIWGESTNVQDERMRQESAALLERVENAAMELSNGDLGWVSVLPQPNVETLFLNLAEESFYSGRCGIALASAAMYHCTGEESYRRFATDAIAPIRRRLGDGRDLADGAIGGANGIGSVAYSLGVIGDLLDCEDILLDAQRAASLLTEDRISQDESYDVLDGSAGATLGLLGLYDRCGDDDLLSTAVQCGEHLLAQRVAGPDGSRVWNTGPESRPLTGFSHGVAGIAYALYRLGHVADAPRFVDASREALRYESSVYSEEHRNWPDYRPDSSSGFVDRWCHGRSGIGLSRAGILRYDDDREMEQVVDATLAAARETDLLAHDHLCCGNSGRIEFLLEGARTLGGDDSAAREYVGRMLSKADATGGLLARSDSTHLTNPTFFLGVSGIAYTLLRVAAPGELPCLLLWE